MREQEAIRVLRSYESDYDNFLKGLIKRKNVKKRRVAAARADSQQADKDFQQAVKEKKPRVFQKLTGFFKDIGGVEGAKETAGNVMQFFKDGHKPSDFEVNIGGKEDKQGESKNILGMPPVAAYSIGGIVVLIIGYGVVKIIEQISKTNIQTAT